VDIESALKEAMEITGAIGTCLVDYESGMMLGSAGGNAELNLEVAAAGNTDVVRAKMATMKMLGLKDRIEDILITLGTQFHIVRPVTSVNGEGLFLYLALNKSTANLAMARRQLSTIENNLAL
jgi:uncharacterized 2Fe-2S/4Fe-4S cluster protein (DUF4445 family)